MYIGVDGCPDGWIAVRYDETFVDGDFYSDINAVWDAFGASAETILVDVPIGLRTDSARKRPCDDAARDRLAPTRHASVFPVPIRPAVHADSYETAKTIQERRTDGSLGVQAWHIADNIAEVDTLLRETAPEAIGTLREAHPEVCFWALNDKSPTTHSKTGAPASAFWERIDILETVDSAVLEHVRTVGRCLSAEVTNDDILDAFVLALTASPRTGPLQQLPKKWPSDDPGDPANLPMEMVYAAPR